MRLIMITQKLDPADPILAFTIEWVRCLAQRVEHLDVMCLEAYLPSDALPANVTAWTLGKERGKNRLRELIAFYRTLLRLAPRADACFSHMVPRYVWLAAPILMLFRMRQYLWFTHRQDSVELRLATALCNNVFSAVTDSFPFKTPKLRAVGHGVDTAFFAPNPAVPRDEPPLLVQVARLMPIKHQATLIRAVAELRAGGTDVMAVLVGNVPPGQDTSYEVELRAITESLGVADRVSFAGGLPATQVRDYYRRATLAINLSPPGLFDKAALESLTTGTPVIVSNPAFDALLRDHAPLLRISDPDDVNGLVRSIRDYLALSPDARARIALDIQGRARTAHSLNDLMDRLVGSMRSVSS